MSKLKCLLQTVAHANFQSLALLVLRVVAGGAFMLHGWGKIQAPMSWMGAEAPVPGFLQFLAAFSEFGGGLAWIIGLLTPLASLGLFATMTVAAAMHLIVRQDPWVSMTGGMSGEPALGYLTVALLLLAMGPGRFSLDAVIFGNRK